MRKAAVIAVGVLLLPATADAQAPRITKQAAVAKVRAVVKARKGAKIVVRCSAPRRGRVTCRVTYTSAKGACVDRSVTVRRSGRRLRVRGLRARCVAPLAPPAPSPGVTPATPNPSPAQAQDPGAAEEPRGDEPRRMVVLNADGGLSIYTWTPRITDCQGDYGQAPYVATATDGSSWWESWCNFDMIDNYSGFRTGRGSFFYYLDVNGVWRPFKMCYPGAASLLEAITGSGVRCDPVSG
jgi:hypothetical protein